MLSCSQSLCASYCFSRASLQRAGMANSVTLKPGSRSRRRSSGARPSLPSQASSKSRTTVCGLPLPPLARASRPIESTPFFQQAGALKARRHRCDVRFVLLVQADVCDDALAEAAQPVELLDRVRQMLQNVATEYRLDRFAFGPRDDIVRRERLQHHVALHAVQLEAIEAIEADAVHPEKLEADATAVVKHRLLDVKVAQSVPPRLHLRGHVAGVADGEG